MVNNHLIKLIENNIKLERVWGAVIEQSMENEQELLEYYTGDTDELLESININKEVTMNNVKEILYSCSNEIRKFSENVFKEDLNNKLNEKLKDIEIKIEDAKNLKSLIEYKEQLNIIRTNIIKKLK